MLIGLCFGLSSVALANGGLVDVTEPAASGGVVLKQSTDVTLVSEKLNLTLLDGSTYDVDARYTLSSAKAQTVVYGIPLAWSMESDGVDFIQEKLTVKLNDKTHKCERIQLDKAGEEEIPLSGWCLVSLEIPKGETIPLHLQYTGQLLREDFATNKSMVVDYSTRVLEYHLFPAGYWNGNAKSVDITVDYGALAPYASLKFTQPHSTEGTARMWHFEDVDLKTLGTLSVELDIDPVLEHRDMAALIKGNEFNKFTTITASSTLSAQGRNTYGVDNLQDGDLNTAWCEGAKGNGVGESLTVRIPKAAFENKGPLLWAFAVSPGYAKSEKSWTGNGRTSSLKVGRCGDSAFQKLPLRIDNHAQPLQLMQAEEYHDSQLFEQIQTDMLNGTDICLMVTIDKTADGKSPDACLSELHFVAEMN
ncbi:MAG: NADase-type glycan-binding domain-containing protein [Myxococcota bacterium]